MCQSCLSHPLPQLKCDTCVLPASPELQQILSFQLWLDPSSTGSWELGQQEETHGGAQMQLPPFRSRQRRC